MKNNAARERFAGSVETVCTPSLQRTRNAFCNAQFTEKRIFAEKNSQQKYQYNEKVIRLFYINIAVVHLHFFAGPGFHPKNHYWRHFRI